MTARSILGCCFCNTQRLWYRGCWGTCTSVSPWLLPTTLKIRHYHSFYNDKEPKTWEIKWYRWSRRDSHPDPMIINLKKPCVGQSRKYLLTVTNDNHSRNYNDRDCSHARCYSKTSMSPCSPRKIPWSKKHFTEEETEAQSCDKICPRLQSRTERKPKPASKVVINGRRQ